jgi:hypothetical protein
MVFGRDDRRRRLAAAACLAVAFRAGASSAEAPMWHALPVAGGMKTLTAAAGLEADVPAWRVLYEGARRHHDAWRPAPDAAPDSPAESPRRSVVPLPLAPDVWRRVMGRAGLPDDRLAIAILEDRRASLLYGGLASLDEPTLEALSADLPSLRRIYERHGETFAAFSSGFVVREAAVVLPGGPEAAPAWERLVGESPRAPARFLAKLLEAKGGHRAFLFDSLARLDPQRQRFALGRSTGAGRATEDALRALAAVFDVERPWWRRESGAFARPDVDPARLLREVRLGRDGALAPPSERAFWHAAFGGWRPVAGPAWTSAVRASSPADAAWLVEQVATGDPATRRLRLEQVLFAQRTFGEAAEAALPDVLAAVQALRDARAAILALERLGTRDPALYAATAAAARAAASPGPEGRRGILLGLQGALGVIDRARFARTLDRPTSEALVRSLLAVPLGDEAAHGRALAEWVGAVLLPVLERGVYGGRTPGGPETTVLRAMAGDQAERRDALVLLDWEGLAYRADPGRAEFVRLERTRARQGGPRLDEVLRSCARSARGGEKGCEIAPVLTSIVYAAHLGDPDGPALAGEDPSRRHELGPAPWALPEEVSGPGVPWHVRGCLLGLERALARLSLHRLAGDALPDGPPVIDRAQRRSLAALAVLVSPAEMTDAGRDAVAGALEAGRRRVRGLRPGDPAAGAVARDAGLEPWRTRALEWLLVHEPESRDAFFSRIELLHVGGPGEGRWDEWGAADTLGSGLVSRLPPPRPLDDARGRAPEPLLGESFADLGLRVAEFLAERRLPACLAPALVAALLPELFAEARPLALDDRLGLDAWVRSLPRERLDDAVASLVGRGPLQPPAASGGSS